jgi:hypothetical protein
MQPNGILRWLRRRKTPSDMTGEPNDKAGKPVRPFLGKSRRDDMQHGYGSGYKQKGGRIDRL